VLESVPEFGYAYQGYDPSTQVRVSLREVDISPKDAREICRAIKGLSLEKARSLLQEVLSMRRPIAFRRYKKEGSHRRGLVGFHSGAYPQKVAKKLLRLLDDMEALADYKGMSAERLRIVHAAAYPGVKLKRFEPRAFGRSSPKHRTLVHVELVGAEAGRT
jgi:large subunit ribosomal protein L22